MAPKIKNIIIFSIIAVIIILVYFFFFNKPGDQGSLVSSNVPTLPITTSTNMNIVNVNLKTGDNDALSQNFLSLLLGVKSITLNDSIFQEGSPFFSLVDSSITLTQDGTEGRTNPFAPIGVDIGIVTNPAPSILPVTRTTKTNTVNKPN